jgi:pilus assembly protein Flp/PilA
MHYAGALFRFANVSGLGFQARTRHPAGTSGSLRKMGLRGVLKCGQSPEFDQHPVKAPETYSFNRNSMWQRYDAAWFVKRGVTQMNRLLSYAKDESGATAIEYGLIAALISVVIIGVLSTIGTNLTTTFQSIADQLGDAAPAAP